MQSTDKKLLISTANQTNLFGMCVVEIRKIHLLSQKSVAIDADMDQSYLAGLESGRRPPPRDRQLIRLMHALQASENEMITLKKARAFYRAANAINELLSIEIARDQLNPISVEINFNKTQRDILNLLQKHSEEKSQMD